MFWADIENKKKEQEKSKEEAAKKKDESKENFLRCISECQCQQEKCAAIGLNQCPVCQDILKYTCSKKKCIADEKKPVMILSAASLSTSHKKKAILSST